MTTTTMSVLVGILAALVVLFIYLLTKPAKVDVQVRLRGSREKAKASGEEKKYAYSKTVFGKFVRNRGSRIIPENKLASTGATLGVNISVLQKQIIEAGAEASISAMEVIVLKILGIFAVGCGAALFLVFENVYILISALVIGACLFFLPQARIKEMIGEKRAAIEKTLPMFIEQVYICIASGAELFDALKTVGENTPGEIGKIVREAFLNDAYGSQWSVELLKKAKALGIDDFEDFVSNVVNAEQKGIPILETLEREVDHISRVNRSRVMGEVSALESKLSPLQVLFCLLPMLAIVMMPVLIQILETL